MRQNNINIPKISDSRIINNFFEKELFISSIPKINHNDIWKSKEIYPLSREIYNTPREITPPYHEGLEYVAQGVSRSACIVSELGYGNAILRIRTTDKEPDKELMGKLQESGLMVGVPSDYANYFVYPEVSVKLVTEKMMGYYEITASSIPKGRIMEAMDTVDLIGKVLLQAKEIPQCRGQDSDDLADLLRMKKFPITNAKYDVIRKKTGAVVSRLAQEYMINPGALQRPMVQFLEVGDLADIALGDKQLQNELRQTVKDIMGWQITQNAGRMTVMDYLPILNRICGALGIPNQDHLQS